MPIFNWYKIHDTSDFGFLFKRYRKVNLFSKIALALIWQQIYDEYIKEFGFGEKYKLILEKEQQLILLIFDKVINDDQSIDTFIEVLEIEIEKLKSEVINKPSKFSVLLANVEKMMNKNNIDEHTCSVSKFYGYIKFIDENKDKWVQNQIR